MRFCRTQKSVECITPDLGLFSQMKLKREPATPGFVRPLILDRSLAYRPGPNNQHNDSKFDPCTIST